MNNSTRCLLALAVFSSACVKTTKPEPPRPEPEKAPPAKGVQLQVPIGPSGADAPPSLAFQITRVYDHEKPLDAAPWHAAGGDWSFFDARTSGGAQFTIGVHAKPPAGDMPFSFGDATLVIADHENAARFVAEFGRAFHAGTPLSAPKPQKMLKLRTAVLGVNVACTSGEGCGGDGSWVATKWFLAGGDAEVFFNYDLKGKTGEFSEKDADYRIPLVRALAALAG